MIVVSYNGFSPWGTQNVPYFSMNKTPIMQAGKIAEVTNITLQGQIVEAHAIANGYANLGAVRDAILNTFSDSFKELHVYDNDAALTALEQLVYKCENVIVEGVDFPDQTYISGGILDWSATLKCYEESYFDNMGIIEKADSFTMNKDAQDAITITHRIYAKGVNTTDLGVCKGGFEHARTFVESRRGLANIGGTFIGLNASGGPGGAILINEDENINRLEGSYEITETWRADLFDLNNATTGLDPSNITTPTYVGKVHARCSVDISKSTFDSDFTDATVTYRVSGGKNTTAAELRGAINDITYSGNPGGNPNVMYAKALAHGLGPIHSCSNFTQWTEAIDVSIEEDLASKTFTKRATYTNDPRWVSSGSLGYPVWVDHDVSIETDEIASITTVTISGRIGSVGPQAQQQSAIRDFLKNTSVNPTTGVSNVTAARAGADAHSVGQLDLGVNIASCLSASGSLASNVLVGEHPHSTNTISEQSGSLLNFAGLWARGYYNQYCFMMAMPKCINYTGSATINPITLNINSPKSISIAQDVERNSASFSLSYSDADWIENYESASYNISVQKPIVYRKSNPSANIDGHYSLTSFGGRKNFAGGIDPMYTRQKHTIRVNLVHSQNKPNVSMDMEAATRYRARQMLSDLDNLYLGGRIVSLPADHETYVVSSNESHSSGDVEHCAGCGQAETASASKVTSYHSNAPLISLGGDPDLNNCVTTLSAVVNAGAGAVTLSDVACLNGSAGHPAASKVILSPGTVDEETLDIVSFTGNQVAINPSPSNAHAAGNAVVSVGNGIGMVW